MNIDIKSFLIGVLLTINIILLYGFTAPTKKVQGWSSSYDCDDVYNKIEANHNLIRQKLKNIEDALGRGGEIQRKLEELESDHRDLRSTIIIWS